MQTSSRIWTQVANSISYNDSHNTKYLSRKDTVRIEHVSDVEENQRELMLFTGESKRG